MAIKYTYIPTTSISRSSKIYPNWYFWLENKPSGNPDPKAETKQKNKKATNHLKNLNHFHPKMTKFHFISNDNHFHPKTTKIFFKT
jgi:hypothetical protein